MSSEFQEHLTNPSLPARTTKQGKPWPGLIVLVVIGTCFLAEGFGAQTPIALEKPRPIRNNRYLFLVETSRSMQRRTNAVFETVHDLVASGMKGQLRPGDTVGLWTYNSSVSTGKLPLQHARSDNYEEIADAITDFLKDQKFENTPSLKPLIPMLVQVAQNSPFITLIFVGSGENDMFGTTFDEPINSMYREWRAKQAKAGNPLVTVLRARHGNLTDFGVHPVPFPIEMPPLPPEFEVTAAPPKPAQKRSNRPLIVSGKKSTQTTMGTSSPVAALPTAPGEAPAQQSKELTEPSLNVSDDGSQISIQVTRGTRQSATEINQDAAEQHPAPSSAPEPEPAARAQLNNAALSATGPLNSSPLNLTQAVPSKPIASSTRRERSPAPSNHLVDAAGKANAATLDPVPGVEPSRATNRSNAVGAGIQSAKPKNPVATESGRVAVAAELQKVAALPGVPAPVVGKSKSRFLGSGVLMLLGFGCATGAALGLIYVVLFKRKAPRPSTSIVTRSLHRQSLS